VRRHPRRVQILELGHFSFFFIVLCRDLLVSHGEARESNRKGGEMSRKLTLTEAERKSLAWLKAEYSTVNGQCVEIASTTDKDKIAIRDSKDPDGPILVYTPIEFSAFLDGARNGEFDSLLR
jgi:hypothetical protein